MSMIFHVRMVCAEKEEFLRDYELSYDMSLLAFDTFLCEDLGYDTMDMTSFFLSNENWERLQEFTLMDMGKGVPGAPMPMEKVLLGQVLCRNHDRLIYVFDQLEDRAMFLELMGTRVADPSAAYPRVVRREGEAPLQFFMALGSGMESAVFVEAMDDFFVFEGDDFYEDD